MTFDSTVDFLLEMELNRVSLRFLNLCCACECLVSPRDVVAGLKSVIEWEGSRPVL
jgi:hypothetical protein